MARNIPQSVASDCCTQHSRNGLGMSSTTFCLPSECAPPNFAPDSVIYNLFVTGGQFIAACICAMLAESSPHGGWRIMFGVGVIPALMQFAAFCYLPETPAWFMAKGKSGKALQVLQRMGRGVEQRDHGVGGVERGPSLNVVDIVCGRADERVNRALRLGMLLQFLQQSTAINVVMYYGTLIVKQSGVKSDTDSSRQYCHRSRQFRLFFHRHDDCGYAWKETSSTLEFGLVNAMLVLLAVAFGLSAPSWIIIVSICLYLITFAPGMSPMPWCICAEIFPARARAACMALSTFTNWATNFVVSLTFLSISETLSPAGAFAGYAFIGMCGFGFLWIRLPETKGVPLDDITI